MGIVSADGNGRLIGKISWNTYDFLDQVPGSDRLVLHRFPLTATYAFEDDEFGNDGFGTMTGSIDLDQDGVGDIKLIGKLVITKTTDKMALECWLIGDEPLAGGSIVIMHLFKREQ